MKFLSLFYKRLCTPHKFRKTARVVFNGATNLPLIVVWSYWGKLLFPFPFSLSRLTCFHWIDVVASCTKLHIAFSKSHASDLDTKQKERCISPYEVSTVHLGPVSFIYMQVCSANLVNNRSSQPRLGNHGSATVGGPGCIVKWTALDHVLFNFVSQDSNERLWCHKNSFQIQPLFT